MKPITKAFKELTKLGYFAKENHSCCSSCGRSEVPEDKRDKVVFYHMQDNWKLKENGSCYLTWSGDAKEICDVFAKHDISTEWDGDKGTRIKITI